MKSVKTIYLSIVAFMATGLSLSAQIYLNANEYVDRITGSTGSWTLCVVEIPENVQYLTIQLHAKSGDPDLYTEHFQPISTEFGSDAYVLAYPNAGQFKFYIKAPSYSGSYVASLEVFTDTIPSSGYQYNPSDYSTLPSKSENFIFGRTWYNFIVDVPAGLDKLVVTFVPDPDYSDDQILYFSRSQWPVRNMSVGDAVWQVDGGIGNTFVLNYPNPGRLYLQLGDNAYNSPIVGNLIIYHANAPYSSPFVRGNSSSNENYIPNPLYQFQRYDNYAYFFTGSMAEQNNVALYLSNVFQYQGISHYVLGNYTRESKPVYRFINNRNGAHFYTADYGEANRLYYYNESYDFEGIAFYSLLTQEAGTFPVYRFYSPSTGSHFFTISENVKSSLISSSSFLDYEGIAWYGYP